VGTDIALRTRAHEKVWEPNWQLEVRDTILGGDIRVKTAERELSYTKSIHAMGIIVGLSGVYDWEKRTPFAGFSIESTPGVTAAANAVSIHHRLSRCWLSNHVQTDCDVQGCVELPSTRFNSRTGKLGLQGPIVVDLKQVTLTAIV
jgi:hypothetical protein